MRPTIIFRGRLPSCSRRSRRSPSSRDANRVRIDRTGQVSTSLVSARVPQAHPLRDASWPRARSGPPAVGRPAADPWLPSSHAQRPVTAGLHTAEQGENPYRELRERHPVGAPFVMGVGLRGGRDSEPSLCAGRPCELREVRARDEPGRAQRRRGAADHDEQHPQPGTERFLPDVGDEASSLNNGGVGRAPLDLDG